MNKKLYNTIIFMSLTSQFNEILSEKLLKRWHKIFKLILTRLCKSFDTKTLKDLEMGKNGPNPNVKILETIVECAQDYASPDYKLSKTSKKGEVTPLLSTFSFMKLRRQVNPPRYYNFMPLDTSNIFPVKKDQVDLTNREKLLEKFLSEIETMVENLETDDFRIFYTHFLMLLQKYLWCIPYKCSFGNVDVSIFDYLKTTAAISACLYRICSYNKNFNKTFVKDNRSLKFQILVGDLSGIQRYIFDITSAGPGGVAKRLRARSFYITILLEGISHKILHEFDLPLCNIIMTSGGKFYILLPNIKSFETKIKNLQCKLDQWFLRQFRGELYINLAQMSFSGEEFKKFGQVLSKLSRILGEKKSKPLINALLNEEGKWEEQNFQFSYNNDDSAKGMCQGCRKNFSKYEVDEHQLCEQCKRDLYLGGMLPKAKYIFFSKNASNNRIPIFDNYFFTVSPEPPQKDNSIYLVSVLNDTDGSELTQYPAYFKFVANHVPIAKKDTITTDGQKITKGSPLDLDYIAESSQGRKMLGHLKGDVDNLGSLLIFGLKDEKKDLNTISRVSSLSRKLDIFFSGWIHAFVEEKFPSSYIVFSGGDDLYIIGPWNETIDMGQEINKEFNRFTANNPNITLSAGIAFARPRTPVSVAVVQAEDQLECSKEKILPKSESESRNQFTAFGETVKWENVPSLIQNAKLLSSWLKNNYISTNFVRNLTIYSEMFKKYLYHDVKDGLKYLPFLCYDIIRNLPSLNDTNKEKQQIRLWAEELKDIENNNMRYLGFITSYALNVNRR